MKNRLILTIAIAIAICYGVHDVQTNQDVQGLRNRLSLAITFFFAAYLWSEVRGNLDGESD